MGWLKLIQGIVSVFNIVSSYLLNKQQQDAGEAIANVKAAKEAQRRTDEANRIKHDTSDGADDYKL